MKCLGYIGAVALAAGISVGARASTVTFLPSVEYTNGTAPTGPGPWLSASFDDHNSTGSVTLTLNTTNLVGTEFVGEWDFNLDPALDPTKLLFTKSSSTGSFSDPSISTGTNGFKAGSDGQYDISFSFATPNADRFGVGDSVTYTITGISTLSAMSFDFKSQPGGAAGPFFTGAHVQSIGNNGNGSGWIAPTQAIVVNQTPEPAIGACLGVVAPFLFGRKRRGGKA